jgi:hypothetical protein
VAPARRHALSPRQRRRSAAQALPRRHDASPRRRKSLAQRESTDRQVSAQPVLAATPQASHPTHHAVQPRHASDSPVAQPTEVPRPAVGTSTPPLCGVQCFGVADVDVTLLVDGCEDDSTLISAAVAASVSLSLHRHRDIVGGESVELVVDSRHVARARDLTAAAIHARVRAGIGETAPSDQPWIGVDDVARHGLSHWVSPLAQGCLLMVAVGAVDERAVVRAAGSGRPAIEFASTVSLSVTTAASVTGVQVGQLVDELRARLSDPRWIAGLTSI